MFAVTTRVSIRAPSVRKTRTGPVASVAKPPTTVSAEKPSKTKTSQMVTAFAAVVATGVLSMTAPALANDHYANDCDPICHVLDDGAAKSHKQEEDMKKSGPDMGSLMEQLQAQRKAEEAAAKGGKK